MVARKTRRRQMAAKAAKAAMQPTPQVKMIEAEPVVPALHSTSGGERAFITVVVIALVVLIGWFSYNRGLQDQALKDKTLVEETQAAGLERIEASRKEGIRFGRQVQQAADLGVCQKHSHLKRLEDHCVAPAE